MQRPPITVSCDCGETREVPYGEAWRCESCGRVWDTNQIPAEEYEGLLRRMKRARLEAFALAAVLAAILVPLIVFVEPGPDLRHSCRCGRVAFPLPAFLAP